MSKRKGEIITFKVDDALRQAMAGIPNRSEFIRNALLSALDSICPVCRGTGLLSANQKRHWKEFEQTHSVEECDDCNEMCLVCTVGSESKVHNNGS